VTRVSTPSGPLVGVRVLNLGGIGPAPFCAMLLADLGADVITIERPGGPVLADRGVTEDGIDIIGRGARRIALDLKSTQGVADARALALRADVVIEGFRPGVTERLGLGPDELRPHNPRLVYARVTGYGQDGPLADRAGHDINYIAQTGLLNSIGRAGGPPQVPINIVGDYGSGGMLSTMGICAALFERERSGTGQVIDSAMVDGVALLMAPLWEKRASGHWSADRGTNPLDTGAATYDVYETSDGAWMAVGSREPQFRQRLLDALSLIRLEGSEDEQRAVLAARFKTRTQAEWTAVFSEIDACVSPVLSLSQVETDPALLTRGTYRRRDGHLEPNAAPRFSRTPARASDQGAELIIDASTVWG
jgi:alpha-methylacyl-CoA racemase